MKNPFALTDFNLDFLKLGNSKFEFFEACLLMQNEPDFSSGVLIRAKTRSITNVKPLYEKIIMNQNLKGGKQVC